MVFIEDMVDYGTESKMGMSIICQGISVGIK